MNTPRSHVPRGARKNELEKAEKTFLFRIFTASTVWPHKMPSTHRYLTGAKQ